MSSLGAAAQGIAVAITWRGDPGGVTTDFLCCGWVEGRDPHPVGAAVWGVLRVCGVLRVGGIDQGLCGRSLGSWSGGSRLVKKNCCGWAEGSQNPHPVGAAVCGSDVLRVGGVYRGLRGRLLKQWLGVGDPGWCENWSCEGGVACSEAQGCACILHRTVCWLYPVRSGVH